MVFYDIHLLNPVIHQLQRKVDSKNRRWGNDLTSITQELMFNR